MNTLGYMNSRGIFTYRKVKKMTGKDFILYILENDLVNVDVQDEEFLKGFVSEAELAEKMDVGLATVRAWANKNQLDGFKINNKLYFLKIEEMNFMKNKEKK